MFNLQIYFHHKAAGFESLLLKSKQNTEALPKSLEREGLPSPAVLPRRGVALAKLRLFVFHSIFQNCLFPPFRILLQDLLSCCLHRLCPRGSFFPGRPGVFTLGLGPCGDCWGRGSLCHMVGAAESPAYSTNIY